MYLDNKEKRQIKKERKSNRKNSDIISKSKTIWTKLIQTKNTSQQNKLYMKELMIIITGKISQLALQHDASRIVQAAAKFGSNEERKIILYELEPVLVEVANGKYSRFLVSKLIKTCPPRDISSRKLIIKAFKGQVYKLAFHKHGSQILDDIWKTFPPKEVGVLKEEFYSRQFTLLIDEDNDDTKKTKEALTLDTILKRYPEKRKLILAQQLELLQKAMDKELFHMMYIHVLLFEYMSCSTVEEVQGLIPLVASEHSTPLLSTRVGSKVFAKLAIKGNSKDRKNMMKGFKESLTEYLLHKDSYIGILCLLNVTDDTKTSGKILKLLLANEKEANAPTRKEESDVVAVSPLLQLALSPTSCKLFLLLLSNLDTNQCNATKYFDPWELELLLQGDKENATSKKDPQIRRKELCAFLRDELCNMCVIHTLELMRSNSGVKVLREVYNSFPSDELVSAIVKACESEEEEEKKLSLFEDATAHLFLKNMFLSECDDEAGKGGATTKRAYYKSDEVTKSGISFASKFFSTFKGRLMTDVASSNRGAFVISALGNVSCVKEQVKKELMDCVEDIRLLSEKSKGHVALLQVIEK